MKTKLKNKVFYIPDHSTLTKVREIIEKNGMRFDFFKYFWNGFNGIEYDFHNEIFIAVNKTANASFNDFKRIMRPTWKKWTERIGITVILVLTAVILFSCGNIKPNQRKAVKHYEKAKKYGLVITYPSQDTIRVIKRDTIVGANGTMKIFETVVEYVKIPCPEIELPKSKTEIRQDGRNYRAGLRNDRKKNGQNKKAETKINSSDNKADTKQTRIIKKQENKQLNCWNWWDKLKFGVTVFIPAFILGFIFRWILKSVKKIKLGLLSWYGNSH